MTKHASLLAAVLVLAGCASQAEMETAYGHALFAWRDASRAELLAKWGPPQFAAAANGMEVLTWEVSEDGVGPRGAPVTYTRAAALPGSTSAVAAPSVGPGPMIAAVPTRCVTRFELRDGVVKDWSFRGVACGAPGFMPPAR